MAQLIKATGEIREVSPKRAGKKFSLDELQGFVGGYIEVVRLHKNEVMVVNEEGRLRGLPYNKVASTVILTVLGSAMPIVGDVLICKRGEM